MYLGLCSRSQLNFFTNHKNNPLTQIFVYFSEEKSVGVKTMRKSVPTELEVWFLSLTQWRIHRMLGILEEKNIQQGIIVFPGNMTPSARKVSSFPLLATPSIKTQILAPTEKVIAAMASQYKLEEFSESDLLVNITHHTLVPKHEVLTQEEKKELLET